MHPLVCFIAASLDGYIAGPNGEIDWLFTDQDYGYTEFYARVDTVVMGRKTYDLCCSFKDYPYPGIPNYVWSRTNRISDEQATFISEPVAEFLNDLKRRPGNVIWLVGGGKLVGETIRHDLLDDLILSIHPILLGDGIPLFPQGLPARRFQFIRSETFSSGLVQLTYHRTQ